MRKNSLYTVTAIFIIAALIWSCNAADKNSEPATAAVKDSSDRKWWKEAVVYQLYPRSFKDSDGDGILEKDGEPLAIPLLFPNASGIQRVAETIQAQLYEVGAMDPRVVAMVAGVLGAVRLQLLTALNDHLVVLEVQFEQILKTAAAEGHRRVVDPPRGAAVAERWRLLPGDRVAVGEDHLAGDPVGVELLVADLGVVRALQPFGVVALPLRHVLAVDLLHQAAVVVALQHPLVELGVVPGLQVLAVLLHLQAGMGVRRDDHVRLVAGVDAFQRIRHGPPDPGPAPGAPAT